MGCPYSKAGDEDIEILWRVSGAVEVVGHCFVEGVLDYAALGEHDGRADGEVNESSVAIGVVMREEKVQESIAVQMKVFCGIRARGCSGISIVAMVSTGWDEIF